MSKDQGGKRKKCLCCDPKAMTKYGITRGALRFLKQKHKHIEMSTAPIMSLLLFQSIPAFISFFSMSLYGVIDSVYIGHGVGELGLAGMGVYGPLDQGLVFNIACFASNGASSLATQALGKKNIALAESYLIYYVLMSLITCASIMIIFIPLMNKILVGLGATEAVREISYPYAVTLAVNSLALAFNNGLGPFMRLENKPINSMVRLLIFAGLNIVIDPIFIFAAKLGLFGAALSTLISGTLVSVYFIIWYTRSKSSATLHMKMKYLSPKRIRCKDFGKISVLSIGPCLQFCFCSIMTLFINMQITKFAGEDDQLRNTAISAYGVCNRVLTLLTTCIMGLTQAAMPIFGYNRGANQWTRAYNVILGAGFWIIVLSLVIEAIIIGLADYVVLAFGSGEEFAKLAPTILRISMCTSFCNTFGFLISSFFVLVQKKVLALITGLARGVFLIILIYVLPLIMNDRFMALWITVPIADILSVCVAIGLFTPSMRLVHQKARDEGDTQIHYSFYTLFRCVDCKRTREMKDTLVQLALKEEQRLTSLDPEAQPKTLDGVVVDAAISEPVEADGQTVKQMDKVDEASVSVSSQQETSTENEAGSVSSSGSSSSPTNSSTSTNS